MTKEVLDKKKDKGAGSLICVMGGDQARMWCQKVDVYECMIPLDEAKLLFEIYNRCNNEYLCDSDYSYAGLDGLVEEKIAHREKMEASMKSGLSYEQIEMDPYEFNEVLSYAIDEEPKRYGSLKKYISKDMEMCGFLELLIGYSVIRESHYWVDLCKTTQAEFDSFYGFNHWYEVVELFDAKKFSFNFNDEDTISIFGSDESIALADLSYGC